MQRISVGDVMTRNIVSAHPRDSLHQCARIMAKERVNSLLITEEAKLRGILTARDILRALTKNPGNDLKKIKAIDIATRKLAVIKPSADLFQAIEKMQTVNFRRLPVLSRGKLIGVVTLKDILAIQPELYKEVHNLMDAIREEEQKIAQARENWPLEGICENCGAFAEMLRVEGQLLCQDCRDEMY